MKLNLLHHNTSQKSLNFQKMFFTKIWKRAETVLKKEKLIKKLDPNTEINVILMTDAQIKKLNHNECSKNQATDVLSFPYGEMSGEIVISITSASQQAREYGMTLAEEVEFLFVHGILHLAGIHHDSEKEEGRMYALMDQIILG